MEVSVKDISRIIKKNLIFIVVVSLIFSVCSYFITNFFIKKTYAATVKLYVSADYKGNSGYDDLNVYNYASKLVATYIQMLDTNNFYSDVAEQFNNKYTPSQLKSKITFTGIDDTEVFKATVQSDSPAEAKDIADAVAKTAPKTIEKLISNNAKLRIVDEATIPKTPVSPNVSRNVLIAFFIGLVLSLIIAFARDYFDVKIKYDEEMTVLCDVPVLSAIPDFAYFSNNVLKASQSEKTENTAY